MVDTPRSATGDCFSAEARQYNSDLVLGKQISLSHDVDATTSTTDCSPRQRRRSRGQHVLVERGYACVLYIRGGGDRPSSALEDTARSRGAAWGSCPVVARD
jgi:hypothetical protein